MKAVHSVLYNDGNDDSIFALVKSVNKDGTLNLVVFPSSSPVEHVSNVNEGTGGVTWRNA